MVSLVVGGTGSGKSWAMMESILRMQKDGVIDNVVVTDERMRDLLLSNGFEGEVLLLSDLDTSLGETEDNCGHSFVSAERLRVWIYEKPCGACGNLCYKEHRENLAKTITSEYKRYRDGMSKALSMSKDGD